MNILISVAVLAFAGIFQEGDAITGWSVPSISSATGTAETGFTFAEDTATGSAGVDKTITATGGTGAVTYTLQTTGTPFSIASDTGVLSLDTALDYETTPSYTIEIHAADSADTVVTGVATVTITVTDVNENGVNEADPVFATTYSPCIVDGSTQDTTLTTVEATDEDTDETITYTITGGNTGPVFKIGAASGVIQVASGITLDKSTTASYDLEVTATDNGSSTKSATTTVSVTVADSCASGSVAVAVSIVTLFVALCATLI